MLEYLSPIYVGIISLFVFLVCVSQIFKGFCYDWRFLAKEKNCWMTSILIQICKGYKWWQNIVYDSNGRVQKSQHQETTQSSVSSAGFPHGFSRLQSWVLARSSYCTWGRLSCTYEPLLRSSTKKSPGFVINQCLLEHDKAPSQTSLFAREFLPKINTLIMPQPPYWPDLTLGNFFFTYLHIQTECGISKIM